MTNEVRLPSRPRAAGSWFRLAWLGCPSMSSPIRTNRTRCRPGSVGARTAGTTGWSGPKLGVRAVRRLPGSGSVPFGEARISSTRE